MTLRVRQHRVKMLPLLHERDVPFPLHALSLPFRKVIIFGSFYHSMYGIASNTISPLDTLLICLGPFKTWSPEHSGGKPGTMDFYYPFQFLN